MDVEYPTDPRVITRQELQGIVSSRAEGTKRSLLDSFKSAKESAAKTAAPATRAAQVLSCPFHNM